MYQSKVLCSTKTLTAPIKRIHLTKGTVFKKYFVEALLSADIMKVRAVHEQERHHQDKSNKMSVLRSPHQTSGATQMLRAQSQSYIEVRR